MPGALIRADPELAAVPILMVSGSKSGAETTAGAGADGFLSSRARPEWLSAEGTDSVTHLIDGVGLAGTFCATSDVDRVAGAG